jgi:protein SCO1/2
MKPFILLFLLVGGSVLICEAQSHKPQIGQAVPITAGQVPDELKGIEIQDKLGAQIPIEQLYFRDEEGKRVKFSDYFTPKKPVILVLSYYGCPSLCGLVLNGMMEAAQKLPMWTPGKEFEILNVSIDPEEDPELAKDKRDSYLEAFGRPESKGGWHFLVAERKSNGKSDDSSIKTLASTVGFGYKYIESKKEYAHGAGIFILTPEGKLSRILYGAQFRSSDLRLALLEASNGTIGTVVERFLLYCYSYDSNTRTYSIVLYRVMQIASILMVVMVGVIYLALKFRGNT